MNHRIGCSVKINKSLQLFLIFYDFVTKPKQKIQNVKFSADTPHKNLGISHNPFPLTVGQNVPLKIKSQDTTYAHNTQCIPLFFVSLQN